MKLLCRNRTNRAQLLQSIFGQILDPILIDKSDLSDVALARLNQFREHHTRRFGMEQHRRWMDRYFLPGSQLQRHRIAIEYNIITLQVPNNNRELHKELCNSQQLNKFQQERFVDLSEPY